MYQHLVRRFKYYVCFFNFRIILFVFFRRYIFKFRRTRKKEAYIDVLLEKIEEQQEAQAAQKEADEKKNKRLGIVNQTIMTLFLYPKKWKLI